MTANGFLPNQPRRKYALFCAVVIIIFFFFFSPTLADRKRPSRAARRRNGTRGNNSRQSTSSPRRSRNRPRRLSWEFDWELSSDHWSYVLNHGDLHGFPTYQQATNLLESFTTRYPQFIRRVAIGHSVENRTIWAYWIKKDGRVHEVYDVQAGKCLSEVSRDFNLSNDLVSALSEDWTKHRKPRQPQTLLTALHHAREPASLTSLLFFIGSLLELASSSELEPNGPAATTATALSRNLLEAMAEYVLRNHEIVAVPFVNPDSYVAIEETGNKMLRKNRRQTCSKKPPSDSSQGVDINRNYDYFFSTTNDPCNQEEYEGPAPFSEPETQAIRCLVDSQKFQTALNFHTYGDMWAKPFNCCPSLVLPPALEDVYNELKDSVAASQFGSAPSVLGYSTGGEADDWLLGKKGVVSMSPELGMESAGFWPRPHLVPEIHRRAFWQTLEVVMKAGYEISAVIYKIPSAVQTWELQLINHGLSVFPHSLAVVVFPSFPSSDLLASLSVWKELSSAEADSGLPFVSPSWSPRATPSPPSSSSLPSSFAHPILAGSVSHLLPRSRSARLKVGGAPDFVAACIVEPSCCRCGAFPEFKDAIVVSLMITASDHALCVEANRAAVVSNVLGSYVATTTAPSISNVLLTKPGSNVLPAKPHFPRIETVSAGMLSGVWSSCFLLAELVFVLILVFLFCLIVSLDSEESTSRLGLVSRSIVLSVMRVCCCCPFHKMNLRLANSEVRKNSTEMNRIIIP